MESVFGPGSRICQRKVRNPAKLPNSFLIENTVHHDGNMISSSLHKDALGTFSHFRTGSRKWLFQLLGSGSASCMVACFL